MHPPEPLPADDTLTPGGKAGWWGGYAALVLVAFCFGVWAANQKPKPAETVLTPPDKSEKVEPKVVPPAPSPKIDPTPEPKKTDPMPKMPDPVPMPMMPEPMAKKDPDPPPPEPKKVEPKKVEPKAAPKVPEVLFVKEVLPIFKAKCTICHGDTKGPKGGIDVRTVKAIEKGGDNGPGVKGNDLSKSSVWQAVDDGSMPPAGKEQLTDAEKTIIRNWILSGAK